MRARVAWWAGLAAALAGLYLAGAAVPTLPAPWHPGRLAAGLHAGPPLADAVALSRWLLLVAGAYLAALGALAEAARVPGLCRAVRPLLRLPLPGGRGFVFRFLGVSGMALASGVLSATAAGASPVAPAPPTMVWLGPVAPPAPGGERPAAGAATTAPATAPPTTVPATAPPATAPPATAPPATVAPSTTAPATLEPSTTTPPRTTTPPPTTARSSSAVPATTAPATAAPATTATDAPPTTPAPQAAQGRAYPPPPAGDPGQAATVPAGPAGTRPAAPGLPPPATGAADGVAGTYVLVPGDSLWSVAERTLQAGGAHAGTEEVGRYWWRLVELNRPRLPNPADPDFVLPGMTVLLPATLPGG